MTRTQLRRFFGSDDASAYVKAEMIIPDEKNVKIESLTATDIEHEIIDKKRQILAMSEELAALEERKLSQPVDDPMNTSSNSNQSQNLLDGYVEDQSTFFKGTFDDPVELSSDDDRSCFVDEFNSQFWVGKDRYIYDLTDAKARTSCCF